MQKGSITWFIQIVLIMSVTEVKFPQCQSTKHLPKVQIPNICTQTSHPCCVFWPAFGCCTHPKAGWNIFFSRFSTFFACLQSRSVHLFFPHLKKFTFLKSMLLLNFWIQWYLNYRFDLHKWIDLARADYLTDNDDISVFFLDRLHGPCFNAPKLSIQNYALKLQKIVQIIKMYFDLI